MTTALTRLHESALFANVAKPSDGPGRFRIRIISAGVGSSGVYPVETLKAAAEANVFKAGTHMYIDHPTESESYERPERTIRDLAGVFATDATFVDEDGGALDVDIEVFSAWRPVIAEMLKTIGVSIRASAEVFEADDQGRPIIGRIIEALSVDFVTHAGRGGKILALIESARSVERAMARGLVEATANDRREQLSTLVKDTYAGENTWAWVRDFDDTTVWFDVESPEDIGTFAQGYALTDDVATALTGARTEVRVVTTYVPVAATADEATTVPTSPAGQSTANESQEDNMATTQIEESRLAQLETDAGRATVLETERDEARRELAEHKTRAKLRPVIAGVIGASESMPAAMKQRTIDATVEALGADATEDTAKAAAEAAKTAGETEAAQIAEMFGVGQPRGLGGGTPAGDGKGISESEFARDLGLNIKEA